MPSVCQLPTECLHYASLLRYTPHTCMSLYFPEFRSVFLIDLQGFFLVFFVFFFSFWKSVCNQVMRCMEAVQSFDSSSRHDNMREKYDCRDSCLWACKDTKHPNNCFIRNMEASLMETDQMTWFKLLFVLSSQVIFFQWAGSWILHRNKSVFSFAAFFSGGACCT